MNFEPLALKHRSLYKKYTTNSYQSSESSFANMFIWSDLTHPEISIISDMLVLRINVKGAYEYIMPFGDNGNIGNCIADLRKICEKDGLKLTIIGADKNFIDNLITLDYKIVFSQDRNFQDYIYTTESLAGLTGKKLHSKKNYVNRFKSKYDYKFINLDSTMADLCYDFAEKSMNIKYDSDKEKYRNELKSVEKLLKNFDEFDLFGGGIFVDNKMIAYTVGEEIRSDTALIHIEKADTAYEGAFAIINYEFANFLKDKYKYLNREEDMGLEGLRKAKLSYKPEYLTDKIRCVFE